MKTPSHHIILNALLALLFTGSLNGQTTSNRFSNSSYDSLKAIVRTLGDSLAGSDYVDLTDKTDTTAISFALKLLELLQYPQSWKYDFKELLNFEGLIESPDRRFRFISFSFETHGTAGSIPYSFIQYRMTGGGLGAFYTDLKASKIYTLRANGRSLYLLTYQQKGNTSYGLYGAEMLEMRDNYMFDAEQTFPNDSSSIGLMVSYADILSYDTITQTLVLNLNDCYGLSGSLPYECFKDLNDPKKTNEDKRSAFLYYDESLLFSLHFNGHRFVQIRSKAVKKDEDTK